MMPPEFENETLEEQSQENQLQADGVTTIVFNVYKYRKLDGSIHIHFEEII